MKIKNYIWDFDGTLFDTYEFLTQSMCRALKENGVNADYNHVSKLIKISVTDVVQYYSTQYDIPFEKISKAYKKFSHNFDYNLIKPFKEIPSIIKFIANNGGQNFIYTHRGESIDVILDYYDLKKYFVEIVDSTNNFPRKPNPQGAEYLIDKYELEKDNTLFVGDREIDILCGKNANVKTCYYNEDICDVADYNIDNWNEFNKLFFIDNNK